MSICSYLQEDFSSGRLKIDIGPAIFHVPVFYLAVAVSQYVTVMQCTVHGIPKQLTIKCIYIAVSCNTVTVLCSLQ